MYLRKGWCVGVYFDWGRWFFGANFRLLRKHPNCSFFFGPLMVELVKRLED